MLQERNGDVDINEYIRAAHVLGCLHENGGQIGNPHRLRCALALVSEYNNTVDFSISDSKYSPTIKEFDALIERLISKGYIRIEKEQKESAFFDVYHLTQKGKDEYASIRNESWYDEELVSWVVNRHVSRSLGALIVFTKEKLTFESI